MQTIKTSLKRAAAIAGLATIGVVLGTPVAASAAPAGVECRGCGAGGTGDKIMRSVGVEEAPSAGQVAGVGGPLALAAVGGTIFLRQRRRSSAE